MDAIPFLFAVLAAAVAVLGAFRARQAADELLAAKRKRQAGRDALAAAMESGHQLIAFLRSDEGRGLSDDDKWQRVKAFEAEGHAAVEQADRAQLPRYHEQIVGSPSPREAVGVRIGRLQEIQDRL